MTSSVTAAAAAVAASLSEAEDFESITGAQESAEPASSSSTTPTPTAASSRENSTSSQVSVVHAPASGTQSSAATQIPSMRHSSLARDRTLNVSGSPSPANSALNSRDASPARSLQRNTNAPPASTARSQPGLLSRKSSTDVSPNRGPGTSSPGLSAAAIQRALSSTTIPQLPPVSSSDSVKAPRPLKSPSALVSGDSTPHWPHSPRLKSPPPPDARSHSRSRRNSLRSQTRRPEAPSTPSIVVQHSSPSPASAARAPAADEAVTPGEQDEPIMSLSMKGPSRGASGVAPKLETVQESSLPATPGFDGIEPQSFTPTATTHKKPEEDRNDVSSSKVTEDLSSRNNNTNSNNMHTGSGSDSGTKNGRKGKMQEQRSSSTHRVSSNVSTKPSLTSLSSRARDPPLRNMTVETETVPSIAQATISNQDRSASGRVDGSLRLKPSNETIRPKKERKPPKRKAPSIHSGTGRSSQLSYHYQIPSRPDMGPRSNTASSYGSQVSLRSYDDRRSMVTMSPPASPEMAVSAYAPSLSYFYSNTNSSFRKASSKADVFEQKVASAVDEANSSDSDATFIYESNPPEHQPHRSRGHHSRTPSMTSIASLADPRLAIRNEHKNPGKKSSMKFTNPYNNPNLDLDGMDRGEGTIRLGSGRAGTGSHHHHIGRHGQGRGALGHILLNDDAASSMSQSSRGRGPSSRHPSQPNSPRFHNFTVTNGTINGNNKYGELSTYDIDAGIVADDERTPLIPSSRSPRVRTPRRRDSVTLSNLQRQLDRRHRNEGGWCRRFAGCLVLSILLLVVVFSSVGLVFATTKPLTNVSIHEIRNVVASQEELILDLVVDAVNPNIVGVTITDMDVSIFAKSKHVGSDKWWHEHGNGVPHNNEEDWQSIEASGIVDATGKTPDGVDEGTDPIEDPDVGEPRTMLLGRIFHFDSPLNFDGSFWQRHCAESIGEIRLTHPGNKTEAGGTKRWEEVSQYPFELIVRGNFKYQLPLSTRDLSVVVTHTYHYDPDAEKKRLIEADESGVEPMKTEQPAHAIPLKPLGRYDRRAIATLQCR